MVGLRGVVGGGWWAVGRVLSGGWWVVVGEWWVVGGWAVSGGWWVVSDGRRGVGGGEGVDLWGGCGVGKVLSVGRGVGRGWGGGGEGV